MVKGEILSVYLFCVPKNMKTEVLKKTVNLLYITYLLNGLLMIFVPVILGIYLGKKFKLPFRIWAIGAATFILSQVGHIPFNAGLTALFANGILPVPPENWQLIFNAVVLGLSAGLWEEVFRYLAFRFWVKDARSWGRGLFLGAGHGGIEAIILGVLVLVSYISMVLLQNSNLSALIPAEQMELAQQQLSAYWSAPWYATILGAVERIFAICFHLSASVLVLQVFLRKQLRWLWLAIGWHMLLDASAVFAVSTWGVYQTEALLGLLALISLAIIFKLRTPEPQEEAAEPQAEIQSIASIKMPEIEDNLEKLDDTRFQ